VPHDAQKFLPLIMTSLSLMPSIILSLEENSDISMEKSSFRAAISAERGASTEFAPLPSNCRARRTRATAGRTIPYFADEPDEWPSWVT
jgi:hypothetical protein